MDTSAVNRLGLEIKIARIDMEPVCLRSGPYSFWLSELNLTSRAVGRHTQFAAL